MADPSSDIKGLQPEVRTKLEAGGTKNTQQLLERARTPKQRTELAHKVGTTPTAIRAANEPLWYLYRLARSGDTHPVDGNPDANRLFLPDSQFCYSGGGVNGTGSRRLVAGECAGFYPQSYQRGFVAYLWLDAGAFSR